MSRPSNNSDAHPGLRLSRLEVGDHEPPRHDTIIRPFKFLTAVMHMHHIDDPHRRTNAPRRAA